MSAQPLLKRLSLASTTDQNSLMLSPQTSHSQVEEPGDRRPSSSTDGRGLRSTKVVQDRDAKRQYQIIAGPIVGAKNSGTYTIEDEAYM